MPQSEKEHNRDLKRSVKKTREFRDDQHVHPRANVMLGRVVALVSKSVNVAEGVVCLIDAGLPEEAFGLSRTLVEIALGLRFVTTSYAELRARFAHSSVEAAKPLGNVLRVKSVGASD